MTEVQTRADAARATPNDDVIAQHVRDKELELHVKARAFAGLLMGVAVWLLAWSNNFTTLGKHSDLLAGAIAFLVGWRLGERVVFALLGGAITYFFMRD